MPTPIFTVYVSNPATNEDLMVLKTIRDLGYEPLVDSLHGLNRSWFIFNFQSLPHRLYYVHLEIVSDTVNMLPDPLHCAPSFSIHYNESEILSLHDWRILHRHMESVFFQTSRKPKLVTRRAKELLDMPQPLVQTLQDEEMVEDMHENYEFESEMFEDRDVCLCTVKKPNVDLPYTVVIRNYSQRGYKPFFTSLFISQSWGVSRYDIGFLMYLWEEMGLGVLDLDKELKEATEACYPSEGKVPEPEPEVYRRSLKDTKVVLQQKEDGTLFQK